MLAVAGELSKPATDAFLFWLWVGLVNPVPGPSPSLGAGRETSIELSCISSPRCGIQVEADIGSSLVVAVANPAYSNSCSAENAAKSMI